ncbi:MAG: hypothetical protein ABIQ18_35560 [Umezawaea sp.]
MSKIVHHPGFDGRRMAIRSVSDTEYLRRHLIAAIDGGNNGRLTRIDDYALDIHRAYEVTPALLTFTASEAR